MNKLTIAHITDIHAGSPFFISNLMTRTIEELNEINPDVVVITGDLTNMGFRQEFTTAKAYLDKLKCKKLLVVPGNHDSRNVGYVHFEELFGPRHATLKFENVTIIGIDSSEPDLDIGRVGRERYGWLHDNFAKADGIKIFAMHHHLLPVPGTGRERNIVYDAGDLLEVLLNADVDLVLTGHKHVPWFWRFENMVVTTAATVSSLKLRGFIKPSYHIFEIEGKKITIYKKFPFGERTLEGIFEKQEKDKRYLRWAKKDLRQLMGLK
jgi:3',5'-cyclic AMP phosphodiesterase CpdA